MALDHIKLHRDFILDINLVVLIQRVVDDILVDIDIQLELLALALEIDSLVAGVVIFAFAGADVLLLSISVNPYNCVLLFLPLFKMGLEFLQLLLLIFQLVFHLYLVKFEALLQFFHY